MKTFKERLLDRFKSDLGIRPEAWTSHGVESGTFMAGARAALEMAADILDDDFNNWRKLAAYDPKRFPGAPCEAVDGIDFSAGQLRELAKELSDG